MKNPIGELNFQNRTLFINDNLPVLRGLNSATVDLIYLDPPFNSKKQYKALDGTAAEGQMFDDVWRWTDLDVRWLGEIARRNPALGSLINAVRQIQGDGTAAYLTMMGIRLLELHRVLKPTGSIFLHCDPTANSYLRLSLDAIFGKDNMRNEIAWCYTGPGSSKMRQFSRKHDTIYWYAKGDQWTFNGDAVRMPYKDPKQRPRKALSSGQVFTEEQIVAMRHRGKIPETWWTDIAVAVRSKKERTGWSTQKPVKLLQRIIKAASNEGDMVLDPFAGCATACEAAEIEGRQWIGIEACDAAVTVIQSRLDRADLGHLGTLEDILRKVTIREDIPKRTDAEGIAEAKEMKTKAYKTKGNFDFLYGTQRGYCKGCYGHYESKDLTFDHITPRSQGGGHELDNLQLLCADCNSTKGVGTMEQLKAHLKRNREALGLA